MVDAPVSGGSEGAQKATLTIFVGGDAEDVERARPVLAAMGKTITHVGPIGAGQAVKAVNQVILAGTYLGVAEGIVLAIKAGLDVEQVANALGGGAAQSWVLANRSGRMLANDYPLGFKVELHFGRISASPSISPPGSAPCCPSLLWPRNSRPGSSQGATPRTTCRRWRERSARSRPWSPRRPGAGTSLSRDRRATSARQASRRTAA